MELAISVLLMSSQQVELTYAHLVLKGHFLSQELPLVLPVPQAALPALMPLHAQLVTLALA